MRSIKVKDNTVREAIRKWRRLSRDNSIDLRWIQAHANSAGNKRADQLAKEGGQDQENLADNPLLFQPIPDIYKTIKTAIRKRTDKLWNNSTSCTQTRHWFPRIDRRKTYNLMRLTRSQMTKAVQLITNFNNLNHHQERKSLTTLPKELDAEFVPRHRKLDGT